MELLHRVERGKRVVEEKMRENTREINICLQCLRVPGCQKRGLLGHTVKPPVTEIKDPPPDLGSIFKVCLLRIVHIAH